MSQPIVRPFEVARFIERSLPEYLGRVCAVWPPELPDLAWGLRVDGHGAWTLRLGSRGVTVQPGIAADAFLQVAIAEADLEPVVERLARASASRTLTSVDLQWPAESLDLVRAAPGTTRVVVIEGTVRRQILLAGGTRAPDAEPSCTLECQLADLLDVAQGRQSLMQIFFEGKLQLTGDPSLPLALASLAVGG